MITFSGHCAKINFHKSLMEQNIKTLLIVDDNDELRTLLIEGLQKNGFQCLGAQDGLQALRLAREKKPDLIVLDLTLPGLSGLEACKEIRKDQFISATPIIMLTGKDTDVDRVIGKVVGANYYLTKPCVLGTLLQHIERLIGK